MLGVWSKLRLATYNRFLACNKEMYKCRPECNRKESNKKALDNLELHRVCNRSGWYKLSLQEELDRKE
jgi:hypothetical protein